MGKTPAFVSELRFLKMNAKAQNTNDPWLHQFAVLTAIITFLLLGIGGLVTSHEAGMSVPDWPTSYGYNMFALPIKFWKGGAFFEHTHRLLASGAGFLTTILVLWLFGKNSRPFMRWSGFALLAIGIASEYLFPNRWLDGVLYSATGLTSYIASFFWPRCEWSVKWLRWLGVLTFLLVVAQGVLGGLRVTMHMDSLGIFHGVLAQFFFVLTCAIALFTSRFWGELAAKQKTFSVPRGLRSHVLFVTILIFLQLILGATMRHQHAGLAIPDFPTAYGKIWPDTGADAIAHYNTQRMDVNGENPITAFQIILHDPSRGRPCDFCGCGGGGVAVAKTARRKKSADEARVVLACADRCANPARRVDGLVEQGRRRGDGARARRRAFARDGRVLVHPCFPPFNLIAGNCPGHDNIRCVCNNPGAGRKQVK